MLSILIPIYNFNVKELIITLIKQCSTLDIQFEIVCIDDASTKGFKDTNKEISNKKNTTYLELNKNIGRSKIRNLLAEKAQYEYLLFLDCDSKIENPNFITNYINAVSSNKIIYGGRCYQKKVPINKANYLRWLYGVKRESIPAKTRCKNTYNYFLTNNFLIPKKIIQKIKFNENIKGYGHEDSAFALQLKNFNIKINHIENPLTHIGLESSQEFISKTKTGVQNLVNLNKQGLLLKDNKLIHTFLLLKKYKLEKVVSWLIPKKIIIQNLTSAFPSLLLFDLFKLKIITTYISKH